MTTLTRREALQTLAAPAILRSVRRPGDKPNLLFLWTDQQRADTMAAYGQPTYKVPVLNRLAAESVVFDRAYVTQPVCTPSRSSVMTGLWPHQSGCVRNNIPLRSETKTFPEILGDSAYRTGYMGKWHLGDEIFPQHGFEEWKAMEDGYRSFFSPQRDRNQRSAYHHFLVQLGYKPDSENTFSRGFAAKLPVAHSKPSFLAQEASEFILKHRAEPWMLYVNFLEPHTPYNSALNDLHSEEEAPLPRNYPGIPEQGEPEWYKRRRQEMTRKYTAAEFKRTNRNYAGLCSLVDQALGRILWALEASGQAGNTIIVFTSDHGDMMGSHHMLAKQVMYEEAVRIPLLLRVPFRNQKPARVPHPVSHIGIVPTLLELMGRKNPGLPGAPLETKGDVFLEWTADETDSGKGPNGRAVISPDGYKLVLYDSDRSLLFDRNKDPMEMNNVFGRPEYKSIQAALSNKIKDWQKRTGDRFPIGA